MSDTESTPERLDQLSLEDEMEALETRQHEAERSKLERAAYNAGRLDTLQERVAWILNQHPETRDSDRELWFRYWGQFDTDNWNGYSINLSDAYKVTHPGSLTRARAKIQNTYGLFKASAEVQRRRGTLAEEERERAAAQRPPAPLFSIYADESGKNAQNLIAASIWFLHAPEILKFQRAIDAVKQQYGHSGEFHFKEIDSRNLEMYVAAAATCVQYASTVSFKAATVPKAGLARQDDAFEDLFYHLLIRGVEHEHTSGRAQLPRRVAFTKDREEEGRDRVMLANLVDRIQQASATRFDDELEPARFESDDSKALELLQVADLFAGSLNRRLNTPGNGPKDVFANQFLAAVGMPDGPEEEEEAGDMTVHVAI